MEGLHPRGGAECSACRPGLDFIHYENGPRTSAADSTCRTRCRDAGALPHRPTRAGGTAAPRRASHHAPHRKTAGRQAPSWTGVVQRSTSIDADAPQRRNRGTRRTVERPAQLLRGHAEPHRRDAGDLDEPTPSRVRRSVNRHVAAKRRVVRRPRAAPTLSGRCVAGSQIARRALESRASAGFTTPAYTSISIFPFDFICSTNCWSFCSRCPCIRKSLICPDTSAKGAVRGPRRSMTLMM